MYKEISLIYKSLFKKISQNKNIYFFGAGKRCKQILDEYVEIDNFKGVFDNNCEDKKTKISNCIILSPEDIIQLPKSAFVVVITIDDSAAVFKQLTELGVEYIFHYQYIYPINNIIEKMEVLYPFCNNGFFYEMGWFQSWETNSCVDYSGKQIPWLTYPCIEFLSTRIKDNMRVCEFGSGYSSCWWGRQVEELLSIEHDLNWYNKMQGMLKQQKNISLVKAELDNKGTYAKSLSMYNKYFDIIVVDGQDRVNCVKNSLGALKISGVFIIDDSDRARYSAISEFLKINHFREIEFWGIGPLVYSKFKTSIWYRDKNCLGI